MELLFIFLATFASVSLSVVGFYWLAGLVCDWFDA
jgi:hypothetical protein